MQRRGRTRGSTCGVRKPRPGAYEQRLGRQLDVASELVRKGRTPYIPVPDCSEGLLVTASFLYLLARRVLALVLLRLRSTEYKELEIIALRQELAVLRRQVHNPEPRPAERAFLAAASRVLPRPSWQRVFFVRPETLLRWHRRAVASRWTYPGQPGRPGVSAQVTDLICRLA